MAPARLLLALLLHQLAYSATGGNVLLCYYAEWALYRNQPGKFYANNVDPKLCTHLVYSYLGMNETNFQLVSRDIYGDYKANDIGMIAETIALREKNPDLKLMVSCGGWSEGSIKYSKMASSSDSRKTFINSVLEFLKDKKFDGFDLAWEYPSARGGAFDDRENFATLLEELRLEFDKFNLLLSVQLMGKRFVIEPGYDVPRISKAVHLISLVTYNMNTPVSRMTGINSPLKSDDEKNVEYALKYILKKGAQPSKVVLGFATYGHQYLMDQDVREGRYIGVPAASTYPGPWSMEKGFIGYNEICYELTVNKSNWTEMWDKESSTPFAISGRKFMSYDNVKSYKKKLNLIKQSGLGGAMVWSIDTDDFKGICQGTRYPLINTIKSFLSSEQDEETTTQDAADVPEDFIRFNEEERTASAGTGQQAER